MTQVTVSEVAKAVTALDLEMARIEHEQLKLASQLYIMMRQQTRLSQKYTALKTTLEALLK